MTDLRQAAQQALEALHYGKANKAVTILREALEQPEQEPVAWMTEDECDVYTRKQVDGYFQHDHIPLYTTPPQRTWVGLTDEDLQGICDKWQIYNGAWMDFFVIDITAKLKERNT